ncbi:MAG: alpha/beta hydrolase [Okeania sp. SIO3I5]|uniref:alpha/beta hydrolase n=1 Tax=Okeania sp. SIO3I5 TaxID=2607805 RepID=UPI0013B86B51|nr:alpha/beta hydrolase [Okeania sp. SIO3I5]NEQ37231.1 alpha/beta hydrolase [Okeania sp. SIO3I5]
MIMQLLKAKSISRLIFSLGLSILSPILTPLSAISAEKIIIAVPDININDPVEVDLPSFQIKIPVQSLENFAKEGQYTDEFSLYSELLKDEIKELQELFQKQRKGLQELLQTPFNIEPSIVEAFMEEPAGKELLKRLGEIIQSGENENGSEALKKSFELAVADPDGLTIINLLKKFPGDIFIELEEGVNLVNELSKKFVEEKIILTELQKQAQDLVLAEKKQNFNGFPDFRNAGNILWEKQSFSFRNPNRDRSSPADIYLPKISGNKLVPVVVISHGLGSDLSSFVYLAEHLASHGFAVIVPEHIGSNAEKLERIFAGFSRPVDGIEFINRPLDIKYLLDEIEEKIGSDPIWRGKLNFQNVGIIGQSFGGYTALSVAGAPLNFEQLRKDCQFEDTKLILNLSLLLQCQTTNLPAEITSNLTDERITAAIAINPVSSGIFGAESKGLSEIKIPVMILASSEDIFAPPIPEQIYPFISLNTPEKYLVISKPATHFSFIEEEENASFELPKKLIGPDPDLAYPYLQTLSVAFFQVYLQNQSQSLQYLSESYLQYLNQEPFTFTLLKSLTEADIQRALDNFYEQVTEK